jgi:hypothetical protein
MHYSGIDPTRSIGEAGMLASGVLHWDIRISQQSQDVVGLGFGS